MRSQNPPLLVWREDSYSAIQGRVNAQTRTASWFYRPRQCLIRAVNPLGLSPWAAARAFRLQVWT